MFYFKAALFILLALYDASFTKWRLKKHGVDIELNPSIRWLCQRVGLDFGVDLGLALTTMLFVVLGWFFPSVLTFMLGVRVCLYLFQKYAEVH